MHEPTKKKCMKSLCENRKAKNHLDMIISDRSSETLGNLKKKQKTKTINCQGKDECEATSRVELSKVLAGVSSHCGTNILQQ